MMFPDPQLRPPTANRPVSAAAVTLLVVVTLALGWHAFHLPGSVILKNNPPADLPWFGFGLNQVFVMQDGSLVVNRTGYVDRMQLYLYDPEGDLSREKDAMLVPPAPDVSGILPRGYHQLSMDRLVRVQPSQHYFKWRKSLKDGDGKEENELPVEFVGPHNSVVRHVVVETYMPHLLKHRVLPNHQFFEVYDAAAYKPPYIWLTTDKGKCLHKLEIANSPEGIEVTTSKTIETGLPTLKHGAIMGIDPIRDELFVMLSDGSRHWYAKEDLSPGGQDNLSGAWEREYAAIIPGRLGHSCYLGTPFSKTSYGRIQQAIMVGFLAGTFTLLMMWSKSWKFISGRTTEGLE